MCGYFHVCSFSQSPACTTMPVTVAMARSAVTCTSARTPWRAPVAMDTAVAWGTLSTRIQMMVAKGNTRGTEGEEDGTLQVGEGGRGAVAEAGAEARVKKGVHVHGGHDPVVRECLWKWVLLHTWKMCPYCVAENHVWTMTGLWEHTMYVLQQLKVLKFHIICSTTFFRTLIFPSFYVHWCECALFKVLMNSTW